VRDCLNEDIGGTIKVDLKEMEGKTNLIFVDQDTEELYVL
jgi:hypothetical protein